MEFLLKSLIPTDLYIKWFNPDEDNKNGVNVFLHIKDNNNTTYSLKLKKNVTRYDVVAFLRQIHDLHLSNDNMLENNDVIKQECSCLFEFYNENELLTALNKMKIFTSYKYVFLGQSSITINHEKDDNNKLWYTHFNKIHNVGKKEESECIACICNKYSYVFDDDI